MGVPLGALLTSVFTLLKTFPTADLSLPESLFPRHLVVTENVLLSGFHITERFVSMRLIGYKCLIDGDHRTLELLTPELFPFPSRFLEVRVLLLLLEHAFVEDLQPAIFGLCESCFHLF